MYLTFTEYGLFLGLKSERLVVKKDSQNIKEFPLNRVKFIVIDGNGITLSSNLIMQCSLRGIHIFVVNFKNEVISSLYGTQYHLHQYINVSNANT